MLSSLKYPFLLACTVAYICTLTVYAQVAPAATISLSELSNAPRAWGAWGLWSQECSVGPVRCGNVVERRQRLCYVYRPTGGARFQGGNLVIDNPAGGQLGLFSEDRFGNRVPLQVVNEAGGYVIPTPEIFQGCEGSNIDSRSCNFPACVCWSQWSAYGACVGNCGISNGVRTRTRACSANCSPAECLGENTQSQACSTGPCATWGIWGTWTLCSKTCEKGRRSRRRVCGGGIGSCAVGQSVQVQNCELAPVCVGSWSLWGIWSICSANCGGGTQTRTRTCTNNNCVGFASESRNCNEAPCISYDFSAWTEWSVCSVSCGRGFQSRTRQCFGSDNSVASPASCGFGSLRETQPCVQQCYRYGRYSQWSQCSENCGGGTRTRSMLCVDFSNLPVDNSFCQNIAQTVGVTQSEACNVQPCYTWGFWSRWSRCDVNCGSGTTTRTRQCISYRGQSAIDTSLCGLEPAVESRVCELRSCYSSAWSRWSDCSVTCGSGSTTRVKTCSHFTDGVVDVSFCGGAEQETRVCNAREACYAYTQWTEYGACSVQCGQGIRTRSRVCEVISGVIQRDPVPQPQTTGLFSGLFFNNNYNTNPGPIYDRNACSRLGYGQSVETEPCEGPPCYTWALWGTWSVCDRTCGAGSTTRTRICLANGVETNEFDKCLGDRVQVTTCQGRPCYAYGAWLEYEACTRTCGFGGTRTRRRFCEQSPGVRAGFNTFCSNLGPDFETVSCQSLPPCYELTGWVAWTTCTASCGRRGTQSRTRECRANGQPTYVQPSPCNAEVAQSRNCPDNPCYKYGRWSVWTQCGATCGFGTRTRSRVCYADDVETEARFCSSEGLAFESESCNLQPCYTLSEWTVWSTCIGTCGSGTRTKTRICRENGEPIKDGAKCGVRNLITTESCQLAPCTTWDQWSSWSSCSTSCGRGRMSKTRVCRRYTGEVASNEECPGSGYEENICVGFPCPSLGQWSVWSSCSSLCGIGSRTRTRQCFRGDDVVSNSFCIGGTFIESSECSNGPCYTTVWEDWSTCSAPCGRGTRTKQRKCLQDNREVDVDMCRQALGIEDYIEVEDCVLVPQCYRWSGWRAWGSCSADCGVGQQERFRACLYYDGTDADASRCFDLSTTSNVEVRNCDTNVPCFYWDNWTIWGDCSERCGGGSQTRQRTCLNWRGVAATDQSSCDGLDSFSDDAFAVRQCNLQPCYSISGWSSWSSCSAQCGSGTVTRERQCWENEKEVVNNNFCRGLENNPSFIEAKPCETGIACYYWGVWSIWGSCNKDCGDGNQIRQRVCLNWRGDDADSVNCIGLESSNEDIEARQCNLGPCFSISQWGAWSGCSADCGSGTETRVRQCWAGNEVVENDRCFGLEDNPRFFDVRSCDTGIACYYWGEWTQWGQCSEPCGDGTQTKQRVCYNWRSEDVDTVNCRGLEASDESFDVRPCSLGACYTISGWEAWSGCSADCGSGTETRVRRCWADGEVVDNDFCFGLEDNPRFIDVRSCDTGIACYFWGAWTQWGQCSEPCGDGTQTKQRVCYNWRSEDVDTVNCRGLEASDESFDVRQCRVRACYSISGWSEWSSCSAQCGSGTRTRVRRCWADGEVVENNLCFGLEDNLQFIDAETCDTGVACYYWGAWDDWSQCSASCGTGNQVRQRTCYNWDQTPANKVNCENIGLDDDGDFDFRECFLGPCYEYTNWGSWGECSKTCGLGQRTSFRFCVTTAGDNGDSSRCAEFGDSAKSEPCNPQTCIGRWFAWAVWSSCSADCGGGRRFRSRKCTNDNCLGDGIEYEDCNVEPCVTYDYSEWGEWSSCSRTCGNGTIIRSRRCLSSEGDSASQVFCGSSRLIDRVTCENKICGPYGPWSEWGRCSLTCEGGVQFRTRVCPEEFICEGNKKEARICNIEDCGIRFTGIFGEWSRWGACSKTCGTGRREQNRPCTGGNRRCRADDGFSSKRIGDCNTFSCDPLRCSVNPEDRIACGERNFVTTQEACWEVGCCFNPRARGGEPMCYHERGYVLPNTGSGTVVITTGSSSASGTFRIGPNGERIDTGSSVTTTREETVITDQGVSTSGSVETSAGSGGPITIPGFATTGFSSSEVVFDWDKDMAYYDDQLVEGTEIAAVAQFITGFTKIQDCFDDVNNICNEIEAYSLDCPASNVIPPSVAVLCRKQGIPIVVTKECKCV